MRLVFGGRGNGKNSDGFGERVNEMKATTPQGVWWRKEMARRKRDAAKLALWDELVALVAREIEVARGTQACICDWMQTPGALCDKCKDEDLLRRCDEIK